MYASKSPETPKEFESGAVRRELTAVLQDHIPSDAPNSEKLKMLGEADQEWQKILERQRENLR